MILQHIEILLADESLADCLLFKEALEEFAVSAHLTTVYNGEQLMEEITKKRKKSCRVFVFDLNMPRKDGFAPLGEIKRSTFLQDLQVIFLLPAELEPVRGF
ncbi:MAG: hypothetical protein IPO72_11705 [Saprospiraceae bacterium]|nr:hypothetical protein [Candidatus Vicinibacter affinis]